MQHFKEDLFSFHFVGAPYFSLIKEMKLLIVNKKHLNLDRLRTANNNIKDFTIVKLGPSDILPFPSIDNDITTRKWVAFKSSLMEKMQKPNYGPQYSKKHRNRIPDSLFENLENWHLLVTINTPPTDTREGITLRVDGKFIRKLHELCNGNITMSCDGELMKSAEPSASGSFDFDAVNISIKDMRLQDISLDSHGFVEKLKIPKKRLVTWSDRPRYMAVLTISVEIPDSYFLGNGYTDPNITNPTSINKEMLMNEICADITIIASNGVRVKCHKCFLVSHSEVFVAMFSRSSKFEEFEENIINMPDMDEETVRAFLKYLYCWEIKPALANARVALQLLQAGHKYNIARLEDCMKEILMVQGYNYFGVDVALELFVFARHLPSDGQQLKMKAVQVLKSKWSTLEASQTYKQLFKDNPEAAMDLCTNAFAV